MPVYLAPTARLIGTDKDDLLPVNTVHEYSHKTRRKSRQLSIARDSVSTKPHASNEVKLFSKLLLVLTYTFYLIVFSQ